MTNRMMHISEICFLTSNLDILLNTFLNNGDPSRTLKKLVYNINFYEGQLDDTN